MNLPHLSDSTPGVKDCLIPENTVVCCYCLKNANANRQYQLNTNINYAKANINTKAITNMYKYLLSSPGSAMSWLWLVGGPCKVSSVKYLEIVKKNIVHLFYCFSQKQILICQILKLLSFNLLAGFLWEGKVCVWHPPGEEKGGGSGHGKVERGGDEKWSWGE